ncbi:bifunctional riboflavin kinase/FAD synthetase [Haloimpatiens massiliensis]|uniref:bifunctional riboflavin kinase/FAD synthetase n=1 Tax=Haloimpatiens massiliensis TaxID=1658110 RepID=UPI000C835076|nr:bifunctional riboflavin kinase/FAD synthetase [Haloimpatiens massiliensis]
MIVMEDKFEIVLPYKTYVALGNFDGLHIGHMELINKTINSAKKNNIKSMVYTFKKHPLSIINKDLTPKIIIDNDTKISYLDEIGVDLVNFVPFDEECMNMEPEKFIELLINHYNVKGVTVGFNFRFGKKNSGNIEILKKLSTEMGFELNVIEPIKIDEHVVSSTYIRNLIFNGDIEKANKLLYSNLTLAGKVVKGKRLGNKIGFPTANISFNENLIVPKVGVYYTKVQYQNESYKGITNVGYSPTVDGENFTIETHILDFKENIYGKEIKISFIKRIRDEVKFNSVYGLMEQLNRDKIFAYKQ